MYKTHFIFFEEGKNKCPLRHYKITSNNNIEWIQNNDTSIKNKYPLTPFFKYELVFEDEKHNFTLRKKFRTLEGIPDQVKNIKAIKGETFLNISWEPPSNMRGDLKNYVIKYKFQKHILCEFYVEEETETEATTKNNLLMENLKPFSTYRIILYANNTLMGKEVVNTFDTKETGNLNFL